jgi:hypothetical protein
VNTVKQRRRLLLVALSVERERLLREDPELVRDLVTARAHTIPGSLELDDWIELQRALFDYQWLSGAEDPRAEALTPRSGLGLYEDRNIDSARIVPAERCRAVAEWLRGLPADCIERARDAAWSPASRGFPQSLGASAADDDEPLVEGTTVFDDVKRYDARKLTAALEQLRTFYAEMLRSGRGVLAVRFHS